MLLQKLIKNPLTNVYLKVLLMIYIKKAYKNIDNKLTCDII